MKQKVPGSKRVPLITAAVFLAVFGTGVALMYLDGRSAKIERKRSLTEVATGQAQSIRSHLDHLLSATFSLETTLRQGDGNIDGFPGLAKDIVDTYGGVANVQLAPGGVVRKIYPLKGNKEAIGHDLLRDPKRRGEALKAIRSKKLTLAGPVELIQGGVAVIGRLPVFLPDETGKDRFWGFTIVLVHLDDLIDLSRVDKLAARGYEWVLWRDLPGRHRRQVFARSTKNRLIKPVHYSFGVPNGTWRLSLSDQRRPLSIVNLAIEFLLAIVISSMAAVAVHRSLTETERLKKEVKARTQDLRAANVALEVDLVRRTRAGKLSEAIHQINVIAMRQDTTIEDALEEVMCEATESVGAEKAMIAFQDGDGWIIRHVCGYAQTLIGHRLSGPEAPELNMAAVKKRPVFVTDASQDKNVNIAHMQELGIRSLFVLPLICARGPIGVIGFYYHSGPVELSDEEVHFADELMARLTVAIETRRLHDTERTILDTVQSALLSVPASVPGLEIGHIYRSATDLAAIGGDFYDVFELGPGLVGILVGDVSGHGVEAANVASLVKNTVRAFSVQGQSPADTLQKVNDVMTRTTGSAIFATAIFGILDVRTGDFKYCNAGHPSMVIVTDDQVDQLEANSGALGAVPGFKYSESKTNLSPRALAVIYTDGITEARRGLEFFGEERLVKAVQELAVSGPRETSEKLVTRVEKFSNGDLTDDLVVLAFRLRHEDE